MAGNDSNALLLVHCDGSDASTTFTDDSVGGSTHTLTANGNAQVDTAQSKFGGASGLFDGTGDYLSTPDSADWDFGTGDFTIDFWIRVNTAADNKGIIGTRVLSTSGWAVFVMADGTVRLSNTDSGSFQATSGDQTFSTGTWHHVALVRKGTGSTDMNIAIDGTFGNAPSSGNVTLDSAASLVIGRYFPGLNSNYYDGHIDELRVSDVARWTADFTPPTAAYDASVDVEVPLKSYSFAGLVPAVAGGGGAVSPLKSFTLAGNAPVVASGGSADVPARQFDFGGGYQTDGINFDGSNDFLSIATDLTGNADSKNVTGSVWFRSTRFGTQYIYDANRFLFRMRLGKIEIEGDNTSGIEVLDIESSTGLDDGLWHHCMFSWDGTTPHLYIDNVSDISIVTNTDQAIDFTANGHAIGANESTQISKWNGDLADLWLDFGTYIDLSDTDNQRKFYAQGTADLGSNGENPTGSSPIMFFSGPVADWHTNKGTGGGFTENGTLTDASIDPPSGNLVPIVATGAAAESPLHVFTLAGFDPAVNIGVNVVSPAGAFTLTGLSPVILADLVLQVPLGSFSLTGLIPDIQHVIDVPLGEFSFTGFDPEVFSRAWFAQDEDTTDWAATPEDTATWTAVEEDTTTWTNTGEDTTTWTVQTEDEADWS